MTDKKHKESTNNENIVYITIENTGKSKNSTSTINYESELLLKQNLETIKATKMNRQSVYDELSNKLTTLTKEEYEVKSSKLNTEGSDYAAPVAARASMERRAPSDDVIRRKFERSRLY